MVDRVEILISTFDGTEKKEDLVEIAGEVLQGLLKINRNPKDAILKAIRVGIEVEAYGRSFKVQDQQAPPGTFDTFTWERKQKV